MMRQRHDISTERLTVADFVLFFASSSFYLSLSLSLALQVMTLLGCGRRPLRSFRMVTSRYFDALGVGPMRSSLTLRVRSDKAKKRLVHGGTQVLCMT